jgi:glycosyltransferase involved in cell wall biosynthesis
MRIALVSTLAARVARETPGSGSVEGLVWTLADGCVRAGHEVTVFGAGGSCPPGDLVATLPGPYGTNGAPDDWMVCEWINLCAAVQQSDRFDVVHAHAYGWGMPLEPLSRAPMLHTVHVWPYDENAQLWRQFPSARVVALSHAQWSAYPDLVPFGVIPHGIDPDAFGFREHGGSYACYLGRFIPGKGPIEAIAAARAAGIDLVLAGPANEYFEDQVAPLVVGNGVSYVGEVRGAERAALLGQAGVLLAPTQAPEPFGLVLAEAMMCGTPVVTHGIGAAPEIVDDGVTGYCASDPADLPNLLRAALELDRSKVRVVAEERFASRRMVADHLALYEQVSGTA